MGEFLKEFFGSDTFMPHGHCYLWLPEILWLHVISDALIVFAYYSIPAGIIYFTRARKDIPFPKLFYLFSAFILLCGTSHVMEILVVWLPYYGLEGIVKALTAIASVATAIVGWKIMPKALRLMSPAALEKVNKELLASRAEVERQVELRTAELAALVSEHREAEQQIKEKAARLVAVMNTVLDGLITINEFGIIESFNPSATRIFGYKPGEVIGKNVKMLMPEPYHKEHDGYLKNYMRTGNAKVIGIGREVSAKRKDGTVFPMELGVNEMHIEGKRLFVGTIRDITRQKEEEIRQEKAELEIKEKAARLVAVMNTVLDGVITISDIGTIESFNPAATRIFGYLPEEVIGQNVKMLMPDLYENEDDDFLYSYMQTNNAKVIGIGQEVSARRKDGSVFPMELGVNEMFIEGKRMFVGTIRDITRQKEEEARQEKAELQIRDKAARLQAVMNTVLDGVITINEIGTIESFNPSATRIFGYLPEEVVGENVKMLMPEPYHREHDGYLHNYMTTGIPKVIGIGREVSARRKDGSVFPMELSVNEMSIEGTRMFVGTVRDITRQKEEEIKREKLIEKLTESNTELERFAYVASHDMQEPLRMITNFSQIICKEYGDALDEKGQDYLKLVSESGERMRDMVDDLLDYARLGSESTHKNTVDGTLELTRVLENLYQLIQESNAQITFDPLPAFRGNPVQFMRLLQNLITNAIKYQSAGNIPVIHIGIEEKEHVWCLSVSDNGIGIDQSFVKQVFEPFRRLHGWESIKGSGIGLAVCKKIVENHGGSIWVMSTPGKGSVFYFTISKQIEKTAENT